MIIHLERAHFREQGHCWVVLGGSEAARDSPTDEHVAPYRAQNQQTKRPFRASFFRGHGGKGKTSGRTRITKAPLAKKGQPNHEIKAVCFPSYVGGREKGVRNEEMPRADAVLSPRIYCRFPIHLFGTRSRNPKPPTWRKPCRRLSLLRAGPSTFCIEGRGSWQNARAEPRSDEICGQRSLVV